MSPSGAGGTEAHPFPSPHSVFRDGPPPHLLGVTRHLFHPSPWSAPWWPGGAGASQVSLGAGRGPGRRTVGDTGDTAARRTPL